MENLHTKIRDFSARLNTHGLFTYRLAAHCTHTYFAIALLLILKHAILVSSEVFGTWDSQKCNLRRTLWPPAKQIFQRPAPQ
jgi:hypothetical protein